MKLISFCLWGNIPKYTIGAIKNAELKQSIYPDWIARFYCSDNVPADIIEKLKSFPNVEVCIMPDDGWRAMFWRFLPASDPDVSAILSRDTDSRLSVREKMAVDVWLASDKRFLSLRDHPWHDIPILGGMWGAKYPILSNMKELIESYNKGNYWQVDQEFLSRVIFPIVRNDTMFIDDFFGGIRFPSNRINYEFVGDSFDENDNRHPDYWVVLKNYLGG